MLLVFNVFIPFSTSCASRECRYLGPQATGKAQPTKEDKVEFLMALEASMSGPLSLQMLCFYKYLVKYGEQENHPNLDKNLFFYVEAQKFKVQFRMTFWKLFSWHRFETKNIYTSVPGIESRRIGRRFPQTQSSMHLQHFPGICLPSSTPGEKFPFLTSRRSKSTDWSFQGTESILCFFPPINLRFPQITISNELHVRMLRLVQRYLTGKEVTPSLFEEAQYVCFKEMLPYWAGFLRQWEIPADGKFRPGV